ncbi:MAG: hypothetical protein K6E59_00220 [Bacilli bacterium]|nr:hypothetical protein [Bacilli bacterium]
MREEEVLSRWDESLALLEAYEPLLSPSQQGVLRMYFRYNLSLAEIASERGTSREAAFDAVKKGLAKMRRFEKELRLVEKTRAAHLAAETLRNATSLEEAKKALPVLEEAFEDGI